MTPRQKRRIRDTWLRLEGQTEDLTRQFYDRLFDTSPNARQLFRNKDMRLQGAALAQMLALFVRSLDEDEPGIVAAAEASGRRHVGYGVRHSDYDGAGEALIWAVQRTLGDEFTATDRAAWTEAYRSLAVMMRRASSGVL